MMREGLVVPHIVLHRDVDVLPPLLYRILPASEPNGM